MIAYVRALSIVLAVGLASSAGALEIGERVKNFTLNDVEGNKQELYKLADKRAVVVMMQGNGCPIVRLAMPLFREVRDQYASQGVEFFLINSNLQDTPAAIKAEADDFGFGLPIWKDDKQQVGEMLKVVRTGEVFVFDPKTWKLMYHGPIDDRLSYEKQRPVQHRYLADAIDAVLAGKPVPVAKANAPGCLINFPNRSQVR